MRVTPSPPPLPSIAPSLLFFPLYMAWPTDGPFLCALCALAAAAPSSSATPPAPASSQSLTPLVYRDDDDALPWLLCVLYRELPAVLRGISARAADDGISRLSSSRSKGSDRNLARRSAKESTLRIESRCIECGREAASPAVGGGPIESRLDTLRERPRDRAGIMGA